MKRKLRHFSPFSFAILVLLLVAAAGIYLYSFKENSFFSDLNKQAPKIDNKLHEDNYYTAKIKLTKEELDSIREGWKSSIHSIGPEKTWQNIVQEYKNEDFLERHNIAHNFGEILYEKGGLDYVRYCDSSFAWGCYMGMFIAAAQKDGLSTVDRMYDICNQKGGDLGCQHGIGHAISEYLGEDKLKESLDICYNLEWHGPLGCAGGALMEHFSPGWFGGLAADAKIKELDPNSPYDVCLNLPTKYQDVCIFRATEWWGEYFHYDWRTPDTYCANLQDNSLMQSCYIGIGSTSVEGLNFDTNKEKELCESLSTKVGSLYCKVGASWRLQRVGKKGICENENVCMSELEKYTRMWKGDEGNVNKL